MFEFFGRRTLDRPVGADNQIFLIRDGRVDQNVILFEMERSEERWEEGNKVGR
jgi:hypothetical protein